jgi:hypothetical protein
VTEKDTAQRAQGTGHRAQPIDERDAPVTRAFVAVLILEAAIVLALWIFQRSFS